MKNNGTFYTALKIFFLITTSIFILFLKQWQIVLGIFIFVIALFLSIKFFKPNKNFLSLWRSFLIIGIAIIAFNMLLNTSPIFLERFVNGAEAAEKIIILGLLVFAFTATTSVNNIISVFAFLPQKAKLLLTVTFGIIPAIIAESRKIVLIQSARGINFRGLYLIKNIIPIIIPLLHRSFQRAEHLAILLATRGYEIE